VQGIFCANYYWSAGNFGPCHKMWCGECYTSSERVKFQTRGTHARSRPLRLQNCHTNAPLLLAPGAERQILLAVGHCKKVENLLLQPGQMFTPSHLRNVVSGGSTRQVPAFHARPLLLFVLLLIHQRLQGSHGSDWKPNKAMIIGLLCSVRFRQASVDYFSHVRHCHLCHLVPWVGRFPFGHLRFAVSSSAPGRQAHHFGFAW
jgi:hypothetical protein